VTKFALPVLVLCLYGLIFYAFTPKSNLPITSPSSNASHEAASTPAEPKSTGAATKPAEATQKPAEAAQKPAEAAEKPAESAQKQAEPASKVAQAESPPAPESQKAAAEPKGASPEPSQDSLRTELQQLTHDIKANTEKIAQTAKLIADSKSDGDKAAQSLREEVVASQAKLADALKASSASSESLARRVDTMGKDIEQVRTKVDDGRKMPFVAFFTALVALFFALFVAYKFKRTS
jgi:outer membrane biosynthesis protein TonB